MTGSELPPQYVPQSIERSIYERWMDAGVFRAHADRTTRLGGTRTPFTIVMPPPNVTAVLHMGHGLNNTIQDVLVRWRRMCSDETLWQPGTDHAGIATQNVVEKLISRDGLTRFELGREAFVNRTTDFVAETGGVILKQLEGIGASCDWTHTAYTLSPELSRAVREAFVTLFEAGLIYRGHRVIHWCPRCLTSLSDEEAEHVEETGALYHVDYRLADDRSRHVTVATTRPETILGDVGLAVHPRDDRYRELIGRSVMLPVVGIPIPVVADEYVDPTFGTGIVKITPAHDPNDFEMGARHRLPSPVVMTPDGRMAEMADAKGRVPEEISGLDRFEAREKIVVMLKSAGQLARTEEYRHAVRHCYRCDTVVEPRLSDQWFVRMKSLAEPALRAVRAGEIRILPERWEAVYINWLDNIRDWNISRQLWWGHRIPVWYCDQCQSTPFASRTDLVVCPACGGPMRQDEDVLDTWFSSWLWPMSTLGWPDKSSPRLQAFYPGDVLTTAPEILFFWVARMIMAGYFFMGKAPFHTVYLHGTVRDTNHVKMSKSLGNGIDPLDVVESYGADALRYTVISGMGLGNDLILDPKDLEKSFASGRNFATKLWNIGRFLLSSVGERAVTRLDSLPMASLSRADRWILWRLDVAISECDASLGPPRPEAGTWKDAELRAGLRLDDFAETARRFVWNELADWYVEVSKSRLASSDAESEVVRAVLVHVFDNALRLLHPIVPFITEELWQRFAARDESAYLAWAEWPRPAGVHSKRGLEFELVRAAVSAIRQVRAEYAIPPGREVDVVIVGADVASADIFRSESVTIGSLARSRVSISNAPPRGAAAHVLLGAGSQVVVPLEGSIDVEKECTRLRGELGQLEKQLSSLEQRLSNQTFLSRAPAHVVEVERQKVGEWSLRQERLREKVKALCGD
ncbi:MAG: valine--tRNA ligase [Gemmatimonadaceae bacterium]